jgi:hypothetical protein
MAPGGDYRIVKDLLTPPREHARRYKEMLRITEQLPPGEKQPPSKKLVLQWYYMTYHNSDRTEYVKSGKKLSAGYYKKSDGVLPGAFRPEEGRRIARARRA